jgi:hypothetical protein
VGEFTHFIDPSITVRDSAAYLSEPRPTGSGGRDRFLSVAARICGTFTHGDLDPARRRLCATINVNVIKALLQVAGPVDPASRAGLLVETKALLMAHIEKVIDETRGQASTRQGQGQPSDHSKKRKNRSERGASGGGGPDEDRAPPGAPDGTVAPYLPAESADKASWRQAVI